MAGRVVVLWLYGAGREGSMKTKVAPLPCSLIFALLLGPGTGAAEGQDDSTDVYTLGEIVASDRAEGAEAAQAISTVTASDIQAKNARTLDQALNLLPGVNVRVGGDGVTRIDVRGFRTRHVLLLLDGIPLNSAYDQQFNPATIPTESIAEIKLTEGASSVLYGQGALGGVINIITKKGMQGLAGTIGAEAGDREPFLTRGSISGGRGGIDFFVSGSSTRLDDYRLSSSFTPVTVQPGSLRVNSDKQRNNVLGNVGYNRSDLSVGLTLNFAQGYYGKSPSVVDDPVDPFANPARFDRVDDFKNLSVQGSVAYDVTKQLSLRMRGFANHLVEQDNRYDDASLGGSTQSGTFREHGTSTVTGAAFQPRLDLGRAGAIGLLLSTEGDDWENQGVFTVAPNTFSPVDERHSFRIHSAAAEYEVSPLPNLGLVAGYGHHWQIGGDRREGAYTALAAAHYDIMKDTRLKASFSRNIRFPTLRDLYDPSQGNPALVAERANTFQVGVEQQVPPMRSRVAVDGFYTRASNLIQLDQQTGKSDNFAKILFRGFEVSAATQPVKALQVRASYTYLNSSDQSGNGRDQLPYSPRDKVAIEARYDFAFGFTPYASFQYLGSQYFYTKNSYLPLLKMQLQNVALIDLKLSQRISWDRLTLYIGAKNLFDSNYESAYGFPQAGRFVYGGFELRI
jgi:outer membrane cobalamin receptor